MLIMFLAGVVLSATELPSGPTPQPVAMPHFPDPLHAFVWRNWQLVPIEQMAKVIGAAPEDVLRLGKAMGLSGPPAVTPEQQRRSYITVIRRNWHLLPYEQLLELLEWTPEKLAFTLREDDFLFVKLGSLKPHCERIQYAEPSEASQQRAREIAQTLKEEFPAGAGSMEEPLFGFVEQLSSPPEPED